MENHAELQQVDLNRGGGETAVPKHTTPRANPHADLQAHVPGERLFMRFFSHQYFA